MNEDQEYMDALSEEAWVRETEGQLSVDVIETSDEIVIRAAIAGVEVEDLDISVTPDTLTIRGSREDVCESYPDGTTHIEECFWGKFSRSVVLPSHVNPDHADAVLKNGILTITLKKAEMSHRLNVVDLD